MFYIGKEHKAKAMTKKWKDRVRQLITLSGLEYITYWAANLYYIIRNSLQPLQGKRTTPWVCALPGFDAASRVDYAREVWADYLKYGQLNDERIKDKRILEIGSGENLGVALLFWAQGAARVDCIDAFDSLLPPDQQAAVYQSLIKTLPPEQQECVRGIMHQDTASGFRQDSINYYNIAAEEIGKKLSSSYQLIFSRAVLEHVVDLPRVIKEMHAVLQPGGKMVHEVDFRDHGMFTRLGFPGLTFLRHRKAVWQRMINRLGAPNRELVHRYVELLRELNYEIKVKVELLLGQEEKNAPIDFRPDMPVEKERLRNIEVIRPRLAHAYRGLPVGVLATAIAMIVAEKPE